MSNVIRFPDQGRRPPSDDDDLEIFVRADTLLYSALYQAIIRRNHRVSQQLLDCLQGEHLGESVVPLPDDLHPYVSSRAASEVIQRMTKDWDDWCKENEAVSVSGEDSEQ